MIAVSGNWSQWTSWSSCDVRCGFGNQSRNRSCVNPPPQHGGANCTGSSAEVRTCDSGQACAVDGVWSEWNSWSNCDVTCGVGHQTRNRSCDNPEPLHGGANCTGTPEDRKPCDNLPPCAVDGVWSPWMVWSNCSVTCGVGHQTRNRRCDNPEPLHGGANCTGTPEDRKPCDNLPPCAVDGVWSPWMVWSNCSVTCGVGHQTRNRRCDNPEPLHGGANCTGTPEDRKPCENLPPCAVAGVWSPWTVWSNCSVTCGDGERTRRRTCDNPRPQHGGANCTGNAIPSVTSDARPDLVDNGTATDSTLAVTFSDRMFSVGLGTITDFTVIVAEDVTGLNDSMEAGLVQNAQAMYSWYDVQGLSPVPPYQVSSPAPYPFASGLRKKRSTESQDISFTIGDENCTHRNVTLYCNGPLKPATTYRAKMRVFTPDGYYADSHYSAAMSTLAYSWSEWTPWSVCTVSCGAGNQTRYRTCNTASGNGSVANCTGDAFQTRACMDIGPCPGPQEPHSTSTAGPTVAQTTPSPGRLPRYWVSARDVTACT
ncbi:coadhesin-like [Branchiostoma floridae x Branchiostoma belcheri]